MNQFEKIAIILDKSDLEAGIVKVSNTNKEDTSNIINLPSIDSQLTIGVYYKDLFITATNIYPASLVNMKSKSKYKIEDIKKVQDKIKYLTENL